MGFRHNGHRDRTTHKGEEYVKMYRLEKWINQCLNCQHRGYNPEMPDEVAQNSYGRGSFAARYVKSQFKPLPLDENGLCEMCRKHD